MEGSVLSFPQNKMTGERQQSL